jgi:hypothetical protein
MRDMRPADNLADRVGLIILAAVAITAAFTFRDYGFGRGGYTQCQTGGGFDMAAALAAKLLPFGLFEARRRIGATVGIIGLTLRPRRRDHVQAR